MKIIFYFLLLASLSTNISVGQTSDSPWPGQNIGTLSCPNVTTVSGNTTGANNDCGATYSGEHLYNFTLGSTSNIKLSLCTGTTWDTELRIFALSNGDCDAGAIAYNDQFCGNQSQITLSCLAAGNYVVAISGYGSGDYGDYSLEITTSNCGCLPPSNDEPCNAIPLTVGSNCSFQTYTNSAATASVGVPAPGCANYQGGDVWFQLQVPASGSFCVDTDDQDITDGDIAIYSGTCNALVLLDCDDASSDNGLMGKIEITGLTPGETIWIRVWEYGNNVFGEFDICVYELGPCGNAENNDFCSNPASLVYNVGGSWSSNTTPSYTADETQLDYGEFCGSLENNSWYQFTATSTTHTFNFSSVSNCTYGDGIQAQVFEIGYDLNGCCTSFSSVSNCWNPGTPQPGVVTATGLTVGNDYMLMVDGQSGDYCDFTVTDWTATGILVLPVVLIDFSGYGMIGKNKLLWSTASEKNLDYFILEKSLDGLKFETKAIVSAHGNSQQLINYEFIDEFYQTTNTYYRLKMVDFDGSTTSSKIIFVDNNKEIPSIYPNPAENTINTQVKRQKSQKCEILITDIFGTVKIKHEILLKAGTQDVQIDIRNLESGMYILNLIQDDGVHLINQKFIKK